MMKLLKNQKGSVEVILFIVLAILTLGMVTFGMVALAPHPSISIALLRVADILIGIAISLGVSIFIIPFLGYG